MNIDWKFAIIVGALAVVGAASGEFIGNYFNLTAQQTVLQPGAIGGAIGAVAGVLIVSLRGKPDRS